MTLPQIKLYTLSTLLLFAVPSFLLVQPAHAADFRLIVSPPANEIVGKPGEVLQKTIKVTNNGTETVSLKAVISDFIVEDDLGTPVKVSGDASGRYFAKPWITLDREKFELKPQEIAQIIAIIDVPKDALPGGHYAGIFFSPVTGSKPGSTGAEVIPEIGSLIEITVAGNINYDAIVSSFQTSAPWYEFGPVAFSATIKNQSDTHINTTPTIAIKNIVGQVVGNVELSKTNIFPFTTRSFAGTWDNVWGLGRYSAELTAPYGEGFVASRLLYFWIIPYRLIAAILIVLMVILTTIMLIRRRISVTTDTRDQELEALKRRLIELENKR